MKHTSTGLTRNVPYYPAGKAGSTAYRKERCRLDIYAPKGAKSCPVVVWFHGGGLFAGEKEIPAGLKDKGLIVVAPNYRLHPQVTCPAYLEDAAAATAWTFRHIAEYGGDTNRLVISGHSAGGFLALMLGLDKKWLAPYGIDPDRFAGIAPLSGQCITHLTIRKERGIDIKQPVVDAFAPLFHVRGDAPPILLLTGDREKEMVGRTEENAYMARMLKLNGHPDVTFCEFQGYGHGMLEPGLPLLVEFVKRVAAGKAPEKK